VLHALWAGRLAAMTVRAWLASRHGIGHRAHVCYLRLMRSTRLTVGRELRTASAGLV
jgi:hypothetical protein